MREPVAIIGVGQLGGTFGHGLLRLGVPVVPVLRGEALGGLSALAPRAILVAVGESDLHATLDALPADLRDRLVLVQNELRAPDLSSHGMTTPTVAVVWFEKKRGRAAKVVRTTRVAGPHAEMFRRALEALDLPARVIDERDLSFELVRKNVYILATNIAGIAVGGTTGELASTHKELALEVVHDVLLLEEAMAGAALPQESLAETAFADFRADPEHACSGRSAPARLARALEHADRLGLAVPALRRIAAG